MQLVTRETTTDELRQLVSSADFVFHLAGVNRPVDEREFTLGNSGFTQVLCEELAKAGRATPVAYASSTQAVLDNTYGRSKRDAEGVLLRHGSSYGAPVFVFRLTNVFGKWARQDYNSVVATFCHYMARGLPISISDPAAALSLLYIDDVVDAFVQLLEKSTPAGFVEVEPVYQTTVGELAGLLHEFKQSRTSLMTARVGDRLYPRSLFDVCELSAACVV